MKSALHDIWQAETKENAEVAFDQFEKLFEAKYPKAVLCLQKDREELMAFYDFPAPSGIGSNDPRAAWRETGCCT